MPLIKRWKTCRSCRGCELGHIAGDLRTSRRDSVDPNRMWKPAARLLGSLVDSTSLISGQNTDVVNARTLRRHVPLKRT